MAKELLIIGTSGTGKSTSLRNLKPEETFIINVAGKSLPFKGSKYTLATKENPTGNMFITDKTNAIIELLEKINKDRPSIKQVIIDDAQYIMANEYMRRAKENGYAKFQDIGQGIFNLVNKPASLRDDLKVVFLMHSETDMDADGRKITKAKTIGKMIDMYITFEGMFSIVLYTNAVRKDNKVEYKFATQTDGSNTCKSPMGMFNDLLIDNDLALVFKAMDEFYS